MICKYRRAQFIHHCLQYSCRCRVAVALNALFISQLFIRYDNDNEINIQCTNTSPWVYKEELIVLVSCYRLNFVTNGNGCRYAHINRFFIHFCPK